jgi:hypothetical protein
MEAMTASRNDSDLRRAPRLRTIKGAKLVLPGGAAAFSCVMRNLSSTGALVELPSTLGVPYNVTLQTDDGSLNRPCTVAWRTETRMGLTFTD